MPSALSPPPRPHHSPRLAVFACLMLGLGTDRCPRWEPRFSSFDLSPFSKLCRMRYLLHFIRVMSGGSLGSALRIYRRESHPTFSRVPQAQIGSLRFSALLISAKPYRDMQRPGRKVRLCWWPRTSLTGVCFCSSGS